MATNIFLHHASNQALAAKVLELQALRIDRNRTQLHPNETLVLPALLAATNLTVDNISSPLDPTARTWRLTQLHVVIADLVLGSGNISRSGHTPEWVVVMRAVRRRHMQVRSAFDTLSAGMGPEPASRSMPGVSQRPLPTRQMALPRYARVNVARVSTAVVFEQLRAAESVGGMSSGADHENLKRQQNAELISKVERDALMHDGLSFPAGTDLHDHPLVLKGLLVLQDRASCMVAHVLAGAGHSGFPRRFRTIVDACAAPGNKASHAASLSLQPNGVLIAVEADATRERLLRQNLRRQRCYQVRVLGKDWLETQPGDVNGMLGQAEAVLVDPSCSNSGTHADVDESSRHAQQKRLHRLSRFQERALIHALSLPLVRRVVYSTCSIHACENEEVVVRAMNAVNSMPKATETLQQPPMWSLEEVSGV